METELRLILCGGTGVGKSTLGNTILGREEFLSRTGASPVTRKSEKKTFHIYGRDITVIDTPSFEELDLEDEFKNALCLSNPGPHVFILVIHLGLKSQDQRLLQNLKKCFGEGVQKFTIVLFTWGGTLGEHSLDTKLREDKDLRDLVSHCGNTYHVFDNTTTDQQNQVVQLLHKIDTKVRSNGGNHYMGVGKGVIPERRRNSMELPRISRTSEKVRLVLLGRTQAGKTLVSDIILPKTGILSSSPQDLKSVRQKGKRSYGAEQFNITVVDTPDWLSPVMSEDDIIADIVRCCSLSAPGPHAFLLVVPLTEPSQEDLHWIKIIQEIFGVGALNYILILFTQHGGRLESVDQLIARGNEVLRELVVACGNRYHVLNRLDSNTDRQVRGLLSKIQNMVKANGGKCYSNSTYRRVEAFIAQMEEEILSEMVVKEHKTEKRSGQSDEEYPMVECVSEKAREEAETSDKSLSSCLEIMKDGLRINWQSLRRERDEGAMREKQGQ